MALCPHQLWCNPAELLESELFGHEKGRLPERLPHVKAVLNWMKAAHSFR